MSHRTLKSIQSFFSVEDGKKKGKEREGTKSHASVIFPLFVGKPPVNGFSPRLAHQEICRTLSSVQIVVRKNYGVWDIRGVKFWVFSLKWLVTLTAVLRYCAACDLKLSVKHLTNYTTFFYTACKNLTGKS